MDPNASPEGAPNTDPAATAQGGEVEPNPAGETGEGGDPEGADALGDKGKKALEAMKAERKAAREEAKALRAELEAVKRQIADQGKSPEEAALEAARREAAAEASAAANKRILRSEVKAAAAGKLADPEDALAHLDLDEFEPNGDGEFDRDELAEAISALLERKPYLAAQGGAPKFDTGRGKSSGASQLTRDEIRHMKPEEIVAARKAGRLNSLLGK